MKRTHTASANRNPSRLTAVASACLFAFAAPAFAQSVEFNLTPKDDAGSYLSAVAALSDDQPIALANAQFKTGAASAGVTGGAVQVDATGTSSGATTVSGNAVAATTRFNTATNSYSGAGAGSFTSTTTTATAVLSGPNVAQAAVVANADGTLTSTVDASFVVASQQVSRNVSSTTKIDTTPISATVTGAMASALTVSNNSQAALISGNTATNIFNQEGGAGSFTGSIAVTNQQADIGPDTGTSTQLAKVISSPISAEASGALSAALTLSGNQQTASVQGNAAGARDANGRILAGNALIISGAASVSGSTSPAGYDNSSTAVASTESPSNVIGGTRTMSGALLLANVQRAEGSTYEANITSSGVQGEAGSVISGGQISLSDNRIRAEVGANLAGNLISIDATQIATGLAIANVQTVKDQALTSTVYGSSINAQSNGNSSGAITVAGNRISASTEGNAASQSTALSANSISTGIKSSNLQQIEGGSSSLISTIDTTSVTIAAGVVTATALTNSGNQTSASTAGNQVSLTNSISAASNLAAVTEANKQTIAAGTVVTAWVQTSQAGIAAEADNSSFTVSDNRIAASASGNSASMNSSIAGTQLGSTSSRLTIDASSDQTVGALTMRGTLGTAGANISAGVDAPAATDSSITVSGNELLASAQGNQTQRSLQISGTSITSGVISAQDTQTNSGSINAINNAAVGIIIRGSADANTLTVSGNTTSALSRGNTNARQIAIDATEIAGNSGVKAYSTQTSSGQVRASTNSAQTIDSDAAVASSQRTVSGNSTLALATANFSSTQVGVTASSLSGQTAQVRNAQTQSGTVEATQLTSTAIESSFGVVGAGGSVKELAGSMTVSDNRTVVNATGNTALNALQINASTASASTTGAPTGAASSTAASYGAFNNQSSSANITSLAKPGLIGISAVTGNTAAADGVTQVVSGNQVTVLASANTATNLLNLNATSSLAASGAVDSVQNATADTGATLGDAANVNPLETKVGRVGGALNYGSATVSGNQLIAQSSGNTVSNALNLASAGTVGTSASWQPYRVTSAQVTSGAVSSTVTNATVGVESTSVTAAPLTVSGNLVAAVASANTASNVLTASSLPGSPMYATFSNTNQQTSSAAVTATVSGVTIGNTVSAGTPSGAMTVSGNTMVAQAGGNSAVNRIIGR